ncbi:DNA-binding transcriptional ArsR family regulator [Micromonospora kangleipakensis]|uniref:DNA-binding transcriptional ArsR family regulator n=1 Tax=Micromonospora kangleipakensis TaxID=1077942 RepID=A0A4Q8BFL1_9ACTN|nr:DUF5937 family protein [Micromonospora kangleipakensis]RZU76201.1 DNA-binding transcriptional ArsR family regulator [Micromonospora kangleipakensis]
MPIAITGLDSAASGRAVPVVSPLVELGSALHVLHDPAHHYADEWAAAVRAGMSPRLAELTQSWSWTTQAIRSAPFVAASSSADFPGQLDELCAIPASQLALQLLRPLSPSGDVRAALHWSRARGRAVAALVQALVERPDQAVADFLEFLEQSWREWFSAEWTRVRSLLAARARRFADTVSAQGAARALATIDPSVTASDAGNGVTIAKVQNTRHDVSRRGLLVAPSAFIRPHLYVADVPGHPLLLIHAAEAGQPVPSVRELLRRLETVANPGRLEIARAIATEPRTAGEIAALWRMDPTLVNRHLRALAAAGLAGASRRGRFVQYHLDVDAIEVLGTDLIALLLR